LRCSAILSEPLGRLVLISSLMKLIKANEDSLLRRRTAKGRIKTESNKSIQRQFSMMKSLKGGRIGGWTI